MTEEQMKKVKKLRKVGILCLHCIRNLAFYRERREELFKPPENQFWRTVDGNFIDICVLEWCKLFADTKAKHYWKKFVRDKDQFLTVLLKELNCTEDQFTNYINEMKSYRDKFLAHLDDENIMNIPLLDKAEKSIIHLYHYLLTHEEEENCFSDAPNIEEYFYNSSSEAKAIISKICESRQHDE